MVDQQPRPDDIPAALQALNTKVDHIAAMVAEIHGELEQFRPVLRLLRPGNGISDVTRAGMIRGMRKAARGG
jgi:prefoldin subunit 5